MVSLNLCKEYLNVAKSKLNNLTGIISVILYSRQTPLYNKQSGFWPTLHLAAWPVEPLQRCKRALTLTFVQYARLCLFGLVVGSAVRCVDGIAARQANTSFVASPTRDTARAPLAPLSPPLLEFWQRTRPRTTYSSKYNVQSEVVIQAHCFLQELTSPTCISDLVHLLSNIVNSSCTDVTLLTVKPRTLWQQSWIPERMTKSRY